MQQSRHYGTITHWFSDMTRGAITHDQSGRRLFIDGQSLSPCYILPRVGDRVSFELDESGNSPIPIHVLPLQSPPCNGKRVTIVVTEWDLAQNGGFGIEACHRGRPVFILGQFLSDQTRVPEVGDRLYGTLQQHENGEWMLTDAAIIELPPQPASTVQKPEKPKQHIAEVFYRAPQEARQPLPHKQVMNGSIIHWDDEKEYGFICFGSEAKRLPFNIDAFHYIARRPEVGQRVSFYCERVIGNERPKAARVVLIDHEAYLSQDLPPDYHILNLDMAKFLPNSLIALCYLSVVSFCSYKIAAFYLIACVISFFLYRSDKLTARQTHSKNSYRSRTPELTLHLADLFGGWPGGLIARAAFRHKTRKRPFIIKFWLTVAINIAITYALLIHYADHPLLSMLRN